MLFDLGDFQNIVNELVTGKVRFPPAPLFNMLLIIDQPYIALNTQPNGKYIIKLVSGNLTTEFVTLKK